MALVGGSDNFISDIGSLRRIQEEGQSSSTVFSDNGTITASSTAAPSIDATEFLFNDTEWDFNETDDYLNISDAPSEVPSHAPSWQPSASPSNSPSAAPTANINKFINSNDTEIIAETFRLYGSLYLVFFLSFCVLRKKFPKYFNIRSWVPELKTDLATNTEYGFISWCWQVFKISDDDLLDTCGMDSLCFLRCLRLGAKLSFVGTINSIWLVPLYLTAEYSTETKDLSDTFVLMSMANVPYNSPRFIGPVIAAYITILTSLYLVSKEYDWYTKYRHKYLSQTKPRNYAVYVSGIPENIRSSFALADYFRQCTSWNDAVFEAHIAMDIPSLDAKVAKRDKLVEKIEHTMALERKLGCTQTHRQMRLYRGEGVRKVESVRTYMEQLQRLNSQITLSAGHIIRSNHRMRQHLKRYSTSANISGLQLDNLDESNSRDRRRWGVDPGVSAPTLATTNTSFSSMRGLDHGEGSFSRIDYCGDIEEGSSQSDTESSQQHLAGQMLNPSSSEESKRCSVTEPSTDESKYPTDRKDTSSEREGPHPFLTMFGLNPSLFNRSTVDVQGSKDTEEALQTLSTDAPDKVYEDKVDDSFDQEENDQEMDPLEYDILSDHEMLGLYLDGSVYEEELEDGEGPDVGHGVFNTDMLGGVGLIPEIIEESDSEIESERRGGGNLSRASSDSKSSFMGGMRTNAKNVQRGLGTVRDMSMSGAKFVGSGTAHVSSQMKMASQVGASKVIGLGSHGLTGVKKAADFGISKIQQAPDLGANLGAHLAASASAVVPALRLNRTEGGCRDAGFIVFRDLYTTQAARQMLQHHIPTSMLVEPAPDPDEVFWRNVGLPVKAKKSGFLLSMSATTLFCFFWSIPMAFLSSLTEVNSLKQNLPTLGETIDSYPALEKFLALIAPLLLLILNEVFLPVILKWFATWEGFVSASVLEASLFVKLCAFVFIQTFFVSAVSGTITAELSNFLEQPERLIDLLANSLPAQSSYFIQICFVFTFLLQGLDLVRAYPLTCAFFRRFVVGPRLTAKERRKTWGMFNSLEDPPEFWHAELLAQLMLFFVIFYVYVTISPITSVFLFFCFIVCESGYRYHFVHNQKPTPDSGGMLWQGFIRVLMASMLIGQCTLFGMLILKKTVYALPALAPLGVITLLYIIFTVPKRNHVATHLPALKCAEIDQKNKRDGVHISEVAAREYLQPALRAIPLYPEGAEIPTLRTRAMSQEAVKATRRY